MEGNLWEGKRTGHVWVLGNKFVWQERSQAWKEREIRLEKQTGPYCRKPQNEIIEGEKEQMQVSQEFS